jgi:UDP-GlcNAc3NAcA epimerase
LPRSIVTILGARPQFVKAAAVSRALACRGLQESIVHTGQHYDPSMSAVFFDELGVPAPSHHLGVGSGSHGAQTAAMLAAIEEVLSESRPGAVLVYGDTNSTLAGALAAAKLHIPVAHVEAGLRSFNRRMPEEVNRVATDHLSTWLFCPTAVAVSNLRAEGIGADGDRIDRQVQEVGDVMFDVTRLFGERAMERATIGPSLGLGGTPYVLATIHRAENTDDPQRLTRIVESLRRVARSRRVVWPMHPRTRKVLASGSFGDLGGIEAVEPVGYLDMLWLERHADVVVTDSGGVQKEAFFAGVPCVTVRDETEWVELVESGWNRLAPPDGSCDIAEAIERASAGDSGVAPYGDGEASRRIAEILGDGV